MQLGSKIFETVLSYAAPAFYKMLSEYDKSRIERIQQTCTRVIVSDLEYEYYYVIFYMI